MYGGLETMKQLLLRLLCQVILDHQALSYLLALLSQNHKKSIKKEACWTVSNITAGNKAQIQVKIMLILIVNIMLQGFCQS